MKKYKITLIPGDGTGPDVIRAARIVLDAANVGIEWDVVDAGEGVIEEYGTPLPDHVLDSIRRNKIALKGPLTTPIGTGFRSVNVALRKKLDLFANVRPARSLPAVKTRYEDVDIIVVRENTEDLYAGIEHMVGKDAAESIKIITRAGSERIVRFAFEYARREGRKKVTAVHKANIMKCTDGLFLDVARQIAKEYTDIEFEDRIVDACSMKIVQRPEELDVLVMPNLYGDILSDICAGLIGGLGVAPGANIGTDYAVFEPVHGSAPKYTGMDKVNPLATILSGVMMLKHLGEKDAADRVMKAIDEVLTEGKYLTYDLGGSAKSSEMGKAIAEKL
ncbi:MAG TPA: isocitrate/isopropylmalate dehydrogenase family protein [Syntrophaceticus sp.]|uniref:Putative isocitrate dehydrogenase (NAD) subunit alpha, mitochondrial n=1 Tax=Syntrophaceticus schinkii TaxID=499207 RepID=A0A0B7MII0_9FIRM|nr:isocitrate/isopropylmalate dehydrogenase family protein [Syntrophaceticus schinkii]HHY29772.1 isocitrate/isopropylmalate dehydrogenase family protein [Syntrophaceticus sp.]MDD2360729.1 isocitrate/isopropylmalate dehydrogenase family protein [Syntrophaceticus schinkii]MDD4261125.1 isocitrate/isopropylmalate dehydrogenase family protein [Syntrophaceticus schinkii]MDD4675566.1 isocitrate/isopropylmalate dehydrogenase family protein [Syntrophaceticus schinkii]CEO88038.1 putative isocitrate dehy